MSVVTSIPYFIDHQPEFLEEGFIALCAGSRDAHETVVTSSGHRFTWTTAYAGLGEVKLGIGPVDSRFGGGLVGNSPEVGIAETRWVHAEEDVAVEEFLRSRGWIQFSGRDEFTFRPPASCCRRCPNFLSCVLDGRVDTEAEVHAAAA